MTTETMDALRLMVRGAYSLQKLRIQAGLRLCANFRDKLRANDAEIGEDEEGELSEKAKKIIDLLKADYRRLTEGVAKNRALPKREGFKGEGLISDFTELVIVHQYEALEKNEREQFRHIGEALEIMPIYMKWLKDQIGIGPAMAAVLVTFFDIERAHRPSQFWAVAGLDVGPDNFARGRRKAHLIERQYKDREGNIKTKLSTTFDPWLQSRLLGVLGASFMRLGSPYRRCYDNYKHRFETNPLRRKGTLLDKKRLRQRAAAEKDPERKQALIDEAESIWHKLRIHRASQRYMVKMFIADFWREWRTLEGLPVVPTYHEQVHGHVHHGPAYDIPYDDDFSTPMDDEFRRRRDDDEEGDEAAE